MAAAALYVWVLIKDEDTRLACWNSSEACGPRSSAQEYSLRWPLYVLKAPCGPWLQAWIWIFLRPVFLRLHTTNGKANIWVWRNLHHSWPLAITGLGWMGSCLCVGHSKYKKSGNVLSTHACFHCNLKKKKLHCLNGKVEKDLLRFTFFKSFRFYRL